MKKFLSLVLALIMVMSLVTVSAGATEYKDFTDKGEIQYEEAVAVLNRLGIITGYSEGDFRPEGELTRGAAAKIIVSLLIGPEAAEALPTTASPYPDVPAGNVFAGYISFCKNSGIISGYNDGTFRPTGTLTGFAFSKMLLGALGYDSDIEKFTGSGWTMNVANIANVLAKAIFPLAARPAATAIMFPSAIPISKWRSGATFFASAPFVLPARSASSATMLRSSAISCFNASP